MLVESDQYWYNYQKMPNWSNSILEESFSFFEATEMANNHSNGILNHCIDFLGRFHRELSQIYPTVCVTLAKFPWNQGCGLDFGVSRRPEVFGWSQELDSKNTRSRCRSRIFCLIPTPEVQLNPFLHCTTKFGIPVEPVQFLLKLLLKQNSCCVPRPPLIISCFKIVDSQTSFTLCFGVSVEVVKFGKLESDILPPTPQPCLKEDFTAFGRVLPKYCFVGKNVTVYYNAFYDIWFVAWEKQFSWVCSIVKMLEING